MTYKIDYETSKVNLQTMKINDLYIHSKYNPIKESENLAEKYYKPHHLHVLFGYGLGYLSKELIKLFKFNEPILVIDPLFEKGLLQLPQEKYGRFYFVNSTKNEVISNYLSQLNSYSNKVVVLCNPNYDKIFPKEYLNILNLVKESQIREIYNINTINKFAETWQLNNLFNLENVLKDNSLKDLVKAYNCPIVIASGGPSLIKQLPIVKKNRNKFILICAGSTINALLKNNVEPDYVVSIDGGLPNYNHFKDLKLKSAQLIYGVTNHYKIRESFSKKGFPFIASSFNSLKDFYLNRFKLEILDAVGGGSVAHYALTIAKKMTTGPIALIGQDLAYTNGDSHAEGNKNKSRIEDTNKEIFEVDGYFEHMGKVKTNDSFITMIDTFEQLQLADPHENEVFNCTEGGAKLRLYEQISFEAFTERFCSSEVKLIELPSKAEDLNGYDFGEFLDKEIEGYKKIIKLLSEGIKITSKEVGPKFNHSTLKRLNKLDSSLQNLYRFYNLDPLLEPIVIRNEVRFLPELNETDLKTFNRVKEYTITLYTECKEYIEKYIEKIFEEMENQYD